MARICSYKELLAYQKAYQLVIQIYRVSKSFPADELYGLISQTRRCAVSIPSNIAEGYMRGSREYVQFLKIALGSAAELETQLYISRDLGYIDEGTVRETIQLCEEVIKLLKTYIQKVSTTSH